MRCTNCADTMVCLDDAYKLNLIAKVSNRANTTRRLGVIKDDSYNGAQDRIVDSYDIIIHICPTCGHLDLSLKEFKELLGNK